MARPSADRIRASVFDRLLEPLGQERRFMTIGLRELRAIVARDIEELLNSKTVLGRDPRVAPLEEAGASILTYGLPDFSMFSWRSATDTRRVCNEIAAAVKAFEPRLVPGTVRVGMLEPGDLSEFRMRFRIEALLKVEPIAEPVYFDSSIQIDTGLIRVEEAA